MTRLSSSSPVTAATTSARSTSARASSLTSQPSATSHCTPGGLADGLHLADPVGVDLDEHDVVLGLGQLGGHERADVAAAHDDDPHQCAALRRHAASRASSWLDVVAGDGEVEHVALLERRGRFGQLATRRGGTRPRPGRRRRPRARRACWPTEAAGTSRSTRHDLGAGVDPLDLAGVGQDPAQHPLGRPLHRGDGGDAEALVDRGPARVVDAGDDPLDAVGLPGDAGDEDVRVVAVGDGGQRPGLLDARPRRGGRGRSRRRRPSARRSPPAAAGTPSPAGR